MPVYLIVMNNGLARTGPSGFTTKHRAERLERMARTGGGKVYYVSTEADLGAIFDSIREELRAHYLLTYYPRAVAGRRRRGRGRGDGSELASDRRARQPSGPHRAHARGLREAVKRVGSRSAVAVLAAAALATVLALGTTTGAQPPPRTAGEWRGAPRRTLEIPVLSQSPASRRRRARARSRRHQGDARRRSGHGQRSATRSPRASGRSSSTSTGWPRHTTSSSVAPPRSKPPRATSWRSVR